MTNISTTKGIDPRRLDQQTLDLGVRIRIFKSTLCPNLKSLESDDHDINCTLCNKRMIDFDPTCSTALLQQQQLGEQFKVSGTFHIDEIMATFLSGVSISPMARIELSDFEENFYELVQRQEGTLVDKLKYTAKCIKGLFAATAGELVEYQFGIDFILDLNGNIKWLDQRRPIDRQIYSVYYTYAPVFRAIKAVHRDRYAQYNLRAENLPNSVTVDGKTFVKLPEQWVLCRDYLVTRRDLNGSLIAGNTHYDPNEEP